MAGLAVVQAAVHVGHWSHKLTSWGLPQDVKSVCISKGLAARA